MRTRPSTSRRALTVRLGATAVALLLAAGACTDEPVPDPPDGPSETAPDSAPDDEGPQDEEPADDPPADDEPAEPEPEPEPEPGLGAYGVSAGDAAAVDAGMRVLEAGGNAVDAAIAAAFAVSVVEPFASGIGGGGAAIVAGIDGAATSYDYREVVAQDGVVPPSDTGIPGFVPGMAHLHEEHGELPWGELLAPAIELAADGATTSSILAAQLRTGAGRLPTGQLAHLYPGGSALSEGDTFTQPELADTLREIAELGVASLTDGTFGASLIEVEGIDQASLEAYEVQQGEPARGRFGDHEVLGAAPPLIGAGVIQLLQVAEALGIADTEPGSADHVHHLAMAWRVADRTIASSLGDPDFVEVPVDELTDADANAAIAADVPSDALLAADVASGSLLAGGEADGAGNDGSVVLAGASSSSVGNTTHVTTVDEDGTIVSMTNTLTNFWGSGQYVDGAFLNDQLRRFSVGDDANRPEPGRRSVSWSSPLVVVDSESRPVLGIGSPGGRRIPTIEAGVLTRWALHGASLADAVEAPRIHLEGDVLEFETLPPNDVADELRRRGYAGLRVPEPVYYFGSVQALEVDHDAGTVTGAVDPRRDGSWDAHPR